MSSVKTFAGLIKKGLDADKPAWASYLEDFIYYSTDLGNLYYYGPSSRTLIQGPEKIEALKNKGINFAENTISGLIKDPFSSLKREGFLTPAATADSSLNLALKGLPLGNGGTYSLVRDAVEGYVSRFNSASVVEMGYRSNATISFVTRRAYNPRLKVRCRSSNAEQTFMFLGFSTKLPTPSGVLPIDATASGIIVGATNTNANYFMRTANGSAFTQTNTTIPRDSIFRTFEIIMSASNIIVNMDGVTVGTLSATLPAVNTDLYLLMELHNRSGTNNFEIAKAYFRDDIA